MKELVAQAKFFTHFGFRFSEILGDVPFKTDCYTAGYESAFNGRISREEIYDYIIEDLNLRKKIFRKGSASLSRRYLRRELLMQC